MKRRRILLLLALAVLVAMGFVMFWPRGPKEPVYQGKRLSQWIEEGYDEENNGANPMARETTRLALKAMGTNALPYLLSEFARKDPRWIEGIKQWAYSHRMLRRQFEAEQKRLIIINYGLHLLGPDAAPGLPELARYLDESRRGGMAASVMENCGELGVPYLFKALDSTNAAVCQSALAGIMHLSFKTDRVLPTWIGLMNHSNALVRVNSALMLGSCRSQPAQVVPPLIRALSDPAPQVQVAAIDSLGGLGRDARPAIPELLRLMNAPASKSAHAASNAVFHIDPAALRVPGP